MHNPYPDTWVQFTKHVAACKNTSSYKDHLIRSKNARAFSTLNCLNVCLLLELDLLAQIVKYCKELGTHVLYQRCFKHCPRFCIKKDHTVTVHVLERDSKTSSK